MNLLLKLVLIFNLNLLIFKDKNITKMSYFLYSILFMFYLYQVKCNFWDNIYSNLQNPNVDIPEEFKLELFNINNNLKKSAEILASSSLNKLKITIYESFKLKTDNVVANLFKQTSNSAKPRKLEESPDNKELLNVVINFSRDNGSIVISSPNKVCQIQKLPNLDSLSVKFILELYNIFTYFKENENTKEYIFTNPSPFFNLRGREKDILTLMKIIGFSADKDKLNFINSDKISKNALIVLSLNKFTNEIENLNIKFENTEYFNFKTALTRGNISPDQFENERASSLCSVIDETQTKSLMQLILEEIIKTTI